MSGVMHAPLTGVFLIAELTAGYDLFMPLMIVSVFAYLTILLFEPHSIYGMRLARQGKLITHPTYANSIMVPPPAKNVFVVSCWRLFVSPLSKMFIDEYPSP